MSTMNDPQAFDDFRSENPDWYRLAPIEIAIMFWNAGAKHERERSGDNAD